MISLLWLNAFSGGVKAVDGEDNEQQLARMAKTEISLTLTNKFEVPDDDDSDIKALFVRY